jgi:hypothetical protein
MPNYKVKGRRQSDRWITQRLAHYEYVADNQVLSQAQAAKVRGMTVQNFVQERWGGVGPRPIVIDTLRRADAKRPQRVYLYVMGELRRYERERLSWAETFNDTNKDFRPQPLGDLLPMVAKDGAVQAEVTNGVDDNEGAE